MFSDGLYALEYAAPADAPDLTGSGLAMLRGGRILGTDRRGSVFAGAYEYDTAAALSRFAIRMQVPPDSELVNGYAAGADGALIDIVAAIEAASTGVAAATVDVAGQPVEVKLTYIGALPN